MSQDANTAQSAEMAKQRHEIEDTVQRLIEDLRRAEIIVQQFQGAESQNALFYKMYASLNVSNETRSVEKVSYALDALEMMISYPNLTRFQVCPKACIKKRFQANF